MATHDASLPRLPRPMPHPVRALGEACRRHPQALVAFGVVFVLYLFGISAILRADFPYVDDLGRTFEGYADWGIEYSRYVSDLLAPLLFAGTRLTDISPLPQVLAAAEMALAGTLVMSLVSGREAMGFWDYVAIVPFGLSPYFLECLSYKFDAPFMALSVLASVLPLALSRGRPAAYVCAVVAGTLVTDMTYQVSSCVLPLVAIMVAFQRWRRDEGPQGRFVALTVLGYAVGMVVFYLFIMKRPSSDAYVSVDLAGVGLASRVVGNYARFARQFLSEFTPLWLVLAFVVSALFVVVSALDTRRPVALTCLLALLALGGFALLAFGLYPLLEEPLIEPRTMYGIGIALALLELGICAVPRAYGAKAVCLALSWCLFVFGFTYGNALSLQGDWIDFRTEQLIGELTTLELGDGERPVDVILLGDAGHSPAFDSMDATERTLLERLIPQTLGGTWWWDLYGVKYYYRLEELGHLNFIMTPTNTAEGAFEDLPLVKETMYDRFYSDGTHLKVEVLGAGS